MQEFAQPERFKNADGEVRRVGFELEFAGIEIDQTARLVSAAIDGAHTKLSEAEYRVDHSELGPFRVELDWSFAKTTAQERVDESGALDASSNATADDPLMKWVTRLAGTIVPIEIVCPPIAIDDLKLLDPVVESLRNGGALGTGQGLLYAFGLHVNPELPDLEAETIAGYLQAYALAEQWLIDRHKIDFSRRVTPYIDNFPEDYISLVMHYGEGVSCRQLIADYLRHNPTRNRALDLLPLFKHIDAEQTAQVIDDPRISPRPTFHYRLPNCEIERPEWSLADSWNFWCVVEVLANQPTERARLVSQWREQQREFSLTKDYPWHPLLDSIHLDLLSA